jgi:ABC-2 type transport system permease protein
MPASPAINAPGSPGIVSSLRKYGRILRISLIERMVYRADFMVSTVFRFLPLVTTLLLWQAIFYSSGQNELSGFTEHQMIAYLLLVQISRMFSSMPGLAAGIARDIRDGSLKKYLLQPINMIAYLLSYRAAHKMTYILTTSLPYGALFFLCRESFSGFPDPLTFLAYLTTLILAFLLGFFFEAMIGMVGFWFLEVTSFLYVINTLNFFVSGQMFPLELLPSGWVVVLKSLPFQYLAYFPAMVFLGKIEGTDLVHGLLMQAAWVATFLVMARWLYSRGLKRYSAYGG